MDCCVCAQLEAVRGRLGGGTRLEKKNMFPLINPPFFLSPQAIVITDPALATHVCRSKLLDKMRFQYHFLDQVREREREGRRKGDD